MRRFGLVALSFLWLFAATSAAQAQKRVALVVGIDSYDNLRADSQLKKARSDAAAVAGTLRDMGFDVIAKEDVTRSDFNTHWQDFLNKLAPGDTATFYFAGHGVELGGRNYLLPRDVPNIRPGRDELLKRESLSLQEFLADLREKGTRFNLVILDACRDNPFERLPGRSVGSARGLAISEPPEGTFIMFSAGTGESALDRLDDAARNPNSVYTRLLLPLLKSPDLSLQAVAEQVRVEVRRTAATVQHRQTPAYYSQVLGQVCLAGGDCGPRAGNIPTTASATTSEAAEAWDRTKDTTSIPILEAFMRRFGDTYYGNLAKPRLAELEQAEASRLTAEATKKAQSERVCVNVETIANVPLLNVMANQHQGTPAGDCIRARIETLKQTAEAAGKKADEGTKTAPGQLAHLQPPNDQKSRAEPGAGLEHRNIRLLMLTSETARRVGQSLRKLLDQIEDARAAGTPLSAIAERLKLPFQDIDGVDQTGKTAQGKHVVAHPDSELLIKAFFAGETGVDNEAVKLRDGGYAWFEVRAVTKVKG